jgi:nucleobase transporter 1/2
MTSNTLLYGLDDRPPLGKAIVFALQHILTMFGATVAVPLMFGPQLWPVDSNADEITQAAQLATQFQNTALLISSVMLCSGIATLIQATWGSRLPIIQGVSFSFLTAFAYIVTQVLAPVSDGGMGGDGAMAMRYIAGAILIGAILEMVIGFTGLIGWLRRAISPVVIGPVIMLIGLALFKHGVPKAGTYLPIGVLTILLVIVFSLVLSRYINFFRLFPILSVIVVVVTLCWVLTMTEVFPAGHPAAVNLSAVHSSPYVRATPSQVVCPWGWPLFHTGFTVAVLAGYFASMIESFGDYHACSYMAGGGSPTQKQISRGIGCEGIGCFLSGLLGGFSSTSYSENIGLVGLTKVGSRYVVQIGAVILIGLGIFGKFGAIAAAIPGPVVGGLYCTLFGLIAAVGIQHLAKADLKSDRNLLIAGFSLFMGLSVPAWFDGSAAFYQPGPETLLEQMPEMLRGIVQSIGLTGMAVAAIIGITLDNLIPGTPEERGLTSKE